MKLLVTIQHGPYSSRFGREGLDVALLGLAFEHEVRVLFLGEGVWQLAPEQAPAAIGVKDHGGAWRSLVAHGVGGIYVAAQALVERGLAADALLLPSAILNDQDISDFMAKHDAILSF